MAYFNGYPATYQQLYPYQPTAASAASPSAFSSTQQAQQPMTPPTIHAEIVQVDDEQAAANYPVGAGAAQMMIAKDDSAIFVKTATANGATLDVFVKRPPAPPAPVFDPAEYVRRDEIEMLVQAAVAAQTAQKRNPKEAKE